MNDEELLRALGELAREQRRETQAHAPLDEVAQERIVRSLTRGTFARRRLPYLGGVAVAAGILLAVVFRGSAALPPYALSASGSSDVRGPAAISSSCTLHPTAEGVFEVVARAETPVSGPVDARAFLVRTDGEVPWPGTVEVSPSGSVRILDASSKLHGYSELRVIIGRPNRRSDGQRLHCTIQ